jgi:5'-3' exonuclease
MRQRLLIFDTSSILHAAKHSFGKSRLSKDDKYTFVVYGFMLKLYAILSKENYDIVAFALDSQINVRFSYYSEYKENRSTATKTKEQIELDRLARPQFKEITDFVIPELGYKNIFEAEGFEADDVIAKICKKYSKWDITIVSTDKDLYQLLTMKIAILNPITFYSFNLDDFREKYGIEPRMWKRVKVYGGCSSDNVKGLPIPQSKEAIQKGTKQKCIGEGFALKYIKKEIGTHTNTYKAFTQPSAKKIIRRNQRLTIIPHKGTPDFTILSDNRMSKNGLRRIIDKYGFKSIRVDFKNFCRVLKLYSN